MRVDLLAHYRVLLFVLAAFCWLLAGLASSGRGATTTVMWLVRLRTR